MKKKFKLLSLLLICLLVSSILMTGCGGNANNGDENTDKDKNEGADTLRIGSPNNFDGMGLEGVSLIVENLMDLNEDQSVSPKLISLEKNDNYTEFTAKVTDGVIFSDGTELDAETVKYNVEQWGKTSHTAAFLESLESLDVVDTKTLKFKMKKPYMRLANELAGIKCVPQGAINEDGTLAKYIGTGPYTLESSKTDVEAVFVLNEKYWNKDKLPEIKKVIWNVIPDETARVFALENGDVDVLGISEHYGSLTGNSLAELSKKENIKIEMANTGLITTYVYNYTAGAMEDIALRKAVTYAIDRDEIVKSALYGFGVPKNTFMCEEFPYTTRNGEGYTYDPEVAKKTLADAGYKDSDGDGIVEKDGVNLNLRFLIQSSETNRSVATVVQHYLKEVGIGTEINALDSTAAKEAAKNGEFDISFTHPWSANAIGYMNWRGATSAYDTMATGFGVNENFAAYQQQINNSLDPEEIWTIFDKVWKELYEAYPGVPLYLAPRILAYSDNVSGLHYVATSTVIDLYGVKINK